MIAGELTDRDAVRRAVSEADAVISAVGPSLDRKATGMPLVDGTRAIVEAMRAEGVEQLPRHGHPACATSATDAACSASSFHLWAALSRSPPPASCWRWTAISRADISGFLIDQTTDTRFHRAAPAISD